MENNNNSPEAKRLLKKYLQHQCTPEEEQQVLRWYFSFDETDDLELKPDQLNRVLQTIKRTAVAEISNKKTSPHKFRIRPFYLQVAAVLCLCSFALFFGVFHKPTATGALVYQELRSAPGEHKSIVLEDGTRVWLNNASVLRYPLKFASNRRQITLSGEAFFEVAHRKHQPFLIQTGHLKVQVLGTSFNVKAYPDDATTVVSVATGKVAVYNSTHQVMLEKGQQVVYTLQNHIFLQLADHPEQTRAWQHNTLFFRYETLEAIARSLERYYGVTINITNPRLAQKKYTLEQHQETLENVLKVLCADEFTYQIKGRSVTIR